MIQKLVCLIGENAKIRYILGPFPLFISLISGIINMHPTIVAHFVFPIIILPVIYSLYYLIAKQLFKDDKKSCILFVIFMSIINMWGNYSVKNNSTFLLFRIWQGKAMLANFIIPATLLFVFKAYENNYRFIDCMLLFIIILAGNLTTTMGIGIPPIVLFVLAFAFEVSEINFKNIKLKKLFINMLKVLCCLLPSIVNGLIYILY